MTDEIRFKFNKIYAPVFSSSCRYIDIWGGRGRGGSHFIIRKSKCSPLFKRNVLSAKRKVSFHTFFHDNIYRLT